MSRTARALVVAVATLAVVHKATESRTANSANITPDVSHALLDELVAALHAQDIDVRTTWSKGEATNRSTLAPLNDFPSKVQKATRGDFEKSFSSGASGTVLAIRQTTSISRNAVGSEQAFRAEWLKAPPQQRIFISFSRSDHSAALAVRDVLQKSGYQVFIYIDAQGGAPAQTSKMTGAYFTSAGHHLVIDSPGARSSSAVAYEAYWVTQLPPLSTRIPTGGAQATFSSGFKGPAEASCWECCTYVNGTIAGCVYLGCGEAAHQRGLATCH